MASNSFILENCAIGNLTGTNCHSTSFCGENKLIKFSDLTPNDQTLIRLRTEINSEPVISICEHRFSTLITRYVYLQKKWRTFWVSHKNSLRI